MPEFAWPWVVLLLPLPWLVARFAPVAAPRMALRLPQHGLALGGGGQQRARVSLMWWLVWLLLLCAAARPQWLGEPIEPQGSGRAMMLAIDISGSMQERDMRLGGQRVSRFEATRAIVDDFVQRREGDQLGLILFGNHAYLTVPLTRDLTTIRKQLNSTAVGIAGRRTAIGDAIAVAVRRLAKLPQQARVLILLTDGVDTASQLDPLHAARIAKQAGVRIYTIGIGAPEGLLPSVIGNFIGQSGAGMGVDTLKQLAESTGGAFYQATDTSQLAAAWRTVDHLEPIKRTELPIRPRQELFRWPLATAALLVLLLALMSGVRLAVRGAVE